jgi:hypothetical protein
MSIQNFIPTLWSSTILKERDRVAIGVKNCNTEWEGDIKSKGDRVKITSIGDITVSNYTKNSTTITVEELKDASTHLEITESKYFAFGIDDVDKAQQTPKVMQEAMRKAAVAIANVADDFVYGKYVDAGTTITQASLTSANVVSTISQAMKALWNNNVPEGAERVLEVSPQVAEKMVLAKIIRDYGNSDTLESGYVGKYMGFKVFVTTGIVQSGTLSYCIARTRDAITFAEQIRNIEAYRPQSSFTDAVKGLCLYGAKTIRPKELVCLTLTTAAESTI